MKSGLRLASFVAKCTSWRTLTVAEVDSVAEVDFAEVTWPMSMEVLPLPRPCLMAAGSCS